MSDDNENQDDQGTAGDNASDVQRGVQTGVQTAQGLSSTIQNASSGNVTGALGGAAGAVGAVAGAIGGEAGQAVQTATQAAQTATQLAGAAQQLAGGNLGQAASSLGSASSASRYLVPDHQAQQVLDGVGQAAGAAGALFDAAGGLLGGLGDRVNVEYHLELDGVDGSWGVRHVELHEQLSGTYECVLHARCDSLPELSDLLAAEAHLQIERGDRTRTLHGIVKHAEVNAADHDTGSVVRLEVVPALWLLNHNFRSRTFTNKTVPQVVEEVFQERLGSRNRTIRNDLTRTYPVHELLVQYQETDLAFIQRRLEQEGIFFYFVHDGDHEELVLADTNSNLPNALDNDESRVAWGNPQTPPAGGECISHAVHLEDVGATDVVVTTYSFTAPEAAPPKGESTGRGELDPPLEIYDHTAALLLHSYQGTQYGANDASDQARMRAEVLDLRRKRWSLASNVVAARPGHVIELTGCPDGALDGRYVIVSVTADGSASEGQTGEYENHLQVIPVDVPFRPAARTRVPKIGGFESAVVVGPSGEEIHTDEHGRVQVRFHWDRDHEPTEPSLCSCWMRVMHNWAGPGFGTTFIPRVGMEVVVAFVQGNPDQPFVLGCLFHGTHHSPVVTPDNKTQSAIRTKSSPNSEGFNELRFEDKAGSEFIFTHAQKDYNEVVENNHSTHVKNCQTNTVDVNQTETVGKNQTMTVKKDRKKTVNGDETTVIGPDSGNRTETVHGDEKVNVKKTRTHVVTDDETLTVEQGKRTVTVQTGKDEETYSGGRSTEVSKFDSLKVIDGANRNVEVTGQYNIKVTGAHYALKQKDTEKFIQASPQTYIESAEQVHIKVGSSDVLIKSDGTIILKSTSKIGLECEGSKIELTPSSISLQSTEIQAAAGPSTLKLESSKATLKGAMVDLLADMFATIKGTLVRIN